MKAAENTKTAALETQEESTLRTSMRSGTSKESAATEMEAHPKRPEAALDGSQPGAGEPKSGSRVRTVLLVIALLLSLGGGSAYYVHFVAPYESTDDAFIEAHVTPIAPQVAGRVASLLVEDNQEVKRGDVLVQIDPSDYQAALEQARANLAAAKSRLEQANAQFTVDQAKVEQEKATVTATEAEARRAGADLKRYQAVGNLGVSESQLDLASTQSRSADAQVTAARNKELAAEAQAALDKASIQTASAEVQKNDAALRQADLNLSYTRILAPEDGLVTHRTVEAGAYVQPGQALLALVPRNVWIIANFKETQLTHMRPGQPVEISVDAYPQMKVKGHVDSIQSGSGARFSLLPPENATGNYVKVVQRVPVKIVLDNATASGLVLGPGMSVEPKVRVQ